MSPELVQEKPYDHNSDLWLVLLIYTLKKLSNSSDTCCMYDSNFEL